MIKIKIGFETLTPLFTGDINGRMTEIKPASVTGSLRFWFEVICHFSRKFNDIKYSENSLNYKKYNEILTGKPDISDVEIFDKLELSPAARYFGCTGLKSRIEIEKIEYQKDKITSPPEPKKIIQNKNWFLPDKYFAGEFTITFLIYNDEIKNHILFPTLNFIHNYGFIGGKNNIGMGRIRIIDFENQITSHNKIKISNNPGTEFEPLKLVKIIDNDALINSDTISYFKKNAYNHNYLESIRNLLKQKSELRKKVKNRYERHYKFGSSLKEEYFKIINNKKFTTDKGTNATKIIPLIRENEIGYLAIQGIISMHESENIK